MNNFDFKNLPITAGVYQFVDETGNILYIGKAKSLRNRVKSYFAKEVGRGPAIDIMVKAAKDIKYLETESEIEALILEAELINKLKPKYNVRLRDDKSFLVIKITKPSYSSSVSEKSSKKVLGPASNNNLETFSCVALEWFKNGDFSGKSAWYFGPYPSGQLLKKSIYFLRKIFPFRDCSKTKYNTYRKKGRPCIYGDIRVCTAPCVDWVDKAYYMKNITYLKNFLRGKKKEVIGDLTKRMKNLSQEKRFEEAALLRDKLNALDHLKDVAIGLRDDLFNGNNTVFSRIECYDISNISGQYAVGSMVVFKDGKKSKDDYRKFKIRVVDQPNDLMMMKEMLTRRFNNDWPLPQAIVIDGGETHLNVAKEVTKEFGLDIPIVSISKGPKRLKNEFHYSGEAIAKYVIKNPDLQNVIIQARDEAHRFAIAYYRSLHKKGMFE